MSTNAHPIDTLDSAIERLAVVLSSLGDDNEIARGQRRIIEGVVASLKDLEDDIDAK